MGVRTDPEISVILPVYNACQYVGGAIDSILNQTSSDFELIVINDGSTDGSLEVIERFASKDPRIVVVTRENRGLIETLNQGLDIARGEWVARMDADDVSMSDRFEKQLRHLELTGADFCGGWIRYFGGQRGIVRYPESHEACEVQLLFGSPFAHPAVIGRRKVFAELKYSKEYAHCEDYDLWQRAWGAGYKFTNVQDVVLRYRAHQNQVSSRHKESQLGCANRVRVRHWMAVDGNISRVQADSIGGSISYGSGRTEELVAIFRKVVGKYKGAEARDVLLFRYFLVFCKLAFESRKPVSDWTAVTEEIDRFRKRVYGVYIGLIKILNMKSSGYIYSMLKKIYLTIRR